MGLRKRGRGRSASPPPALRVCFRAVLAQQEESCLSFLTVCDRDPGSSESIYGDPFMAWLLSPGTGCTGQSSHRGPAHLTSRLSPAALLRRALPGGRIFSHTVTCPSQAPGHRRAFLSKWDHPGTSAHQPSFWLCLRPGGAEHWGFPKNLHREAEPQARLGAARMRPSGRKAPRGICGWKYNVTPAGLVMSDT